MHVLTSLDYGGVERRMENMVSASASAKAKLRHAFVAIGTGGTTEQRLRDAGVQVYCLGKKVNIPSLAGGIALLSLFLKEKPAVVHAHGAEANFHALIAAFMTWVPIRIGEEIGIPNHSSKAILVFRQIYRLAHRVVGISGVVSRYLIESKDAPSRKVVTLLNPVVLPPARTASPSDDKVALRICCVGRLEIVKNQQLLIGAAKQLLTKNVPVEIWMIGEGSQRPQLERALGTLGLEACVKLLGFQANPMTFVSRCSVYVQPSLSEGFGLALVEAMGCGVPVVSTAVGVAPELVEHGSAGWILEAPTEAALVAALLEAWHVGSERLAEMGRNARRAVEGRFEPADYLPRLEALYAEVAKERGVNLG